MRLYVSSEGEEAGSWKDTFLNGFFERAPHYSEVVALLACGVRDSADSCPWRARRASCIWCHNVVSRALCTADDLWSLVKVNSTACLGLRWHAGKQCSLHSCCCESKLNRSLVGSTHILASSDNGGFVLSRRFDNALKIKFRLLLDFIRLTPSVVSS